jgi:hypothetical protein
METLEPADGVRFDTDVIAGATTTGIETVAVPS